MNDGAPRRRLLVAAAVCGGLALLLSQVGDRPRQTEALCCLRPELAHLVRIARAARAVEARLTGGFSYAPYEPALARSPELSRRVLASGLTVRRAAAPQPDPALEAALGSTYLLAGRTNEAVLMLERAAAWPSAPAAWLSDLAAAYLTRGDRHTQAVDYIRALALADRAIARDPQMREAWFNRSLAIDRLALPQAPESWTDYIAIERERGYIAEAAAYRDRATGRRGAPTSDTALDGRDLSPYFDWARAVVAGSEPAAAAALGSADDTARQAGGDRFHADVLQELRATRGQSVQQQRVARGVLALADGHSYLESDDLVSARQAFTRAAASLRQDSGALAALSQFRQAYVDYYLGRFTPALERLADVARLAATRRYPVLRARALRLRGLMYATQGRYDAAFADYALAREAAMAAGAHAQAAALDNLLSEVLDFLGQHGEAWNYRARALAALPAVRDPGQRLSIVVISALAALEQDWPEAAFHLQAPALEIARDSRLPADIAEAWLLRGRVERALGRSDAAVAAIQRASEAIEAIQDPMLRARNEAELALVRASVGAEPSDAADAGLRYFSEHEALSRLTEVYRARAVVSLGAGDVERARRELRHALTVFDRRARLLDGAERRLTHASTGRRLYEALLALELRHGGDPWDGLQIWDRFHHRFDPSLAPDAGFETELRATLQQAGATALIYASLPDRLVIWHISGAHGLRTVERAIGRAQLSALVDALSDAVLQNDRARAARAGGELFTLLLDPVADAETDRLWLVPDGPLHRLPFGVLMDAATGRLALERWILVTRPVLLRLDRGNAGPSRHVVDSVFVAANPGTPEASPLPHAEREAFDIARLYPRRTVVTKADATRDAIARGLRTASTFHFAGHALVNRDRPLLSRLLVAPDEPGTSDALFVYDLQQMDLRRLRLAVLAACRSADAGSLGTDGVISLAGALLRGGVGSVVASLFDLDDDGARRLFVRFHEEYRRTGDAPASLRAAQLAEARVPGQTRLSDWAGVVVVEAGTR